MHNQRLDGNIYIIQSSPYAAIYLSVQLSIQWRLTMYRSSSDYYKFLALAEWSYNTTFHSSTWVTLYEVAYGKPPPLIPHYILGSSINQAVDSLLFTRKNIHESLKCHLAKAQACMQHYVDTKRHHEEFQVGQWVNVKLQPFRQTSVSGGNHQKLTKWYFIPFEIIECIVKVAYRLCLPANSKNPPGFSLLITSPSDRGRTRIK